MQLNKFLELMEAIAPRALAEEWDNPGLLIEPESHEITRVLVALDCTPQVAQEAAKVNAQLVLTHHPLFFKPVRSIHHSAPETAAAWQLIRNGIGLFAAHTNLDSAINGVNDALAAAIGLSQVRSLSDAALSAETADIGRIGFLKETMPLATFAALVGQKLNAPIRYCGDAQKTISKVAVVGGSGASFLREAKMAGADVLVTGDVKHSDALEANVLGLTIIAAGHYETEAVVLAPLISSLQAQLDALQCKVDLLQAKSDVAPFVPVN